MSPSEFIDAIKSEVRDAARTDTLTQLRTPSGHKPSENIQRLSKWFNQLSDTEQLVVGEIVDLASNNTVFGLLCVLDGVRPIQEGKQTGELRLSFVGKDASEVLLNPSKGEMLHDLFNAP